MPGVVDGIATAIGTGVEPATMADDVVVGLRVGVGCEAAMLDNGPTAVDVRAVDDDIIAAPEAEID